MSLRQDKKVFSTVKEIIGSKYVISVFIAIALISTSTYQFLFLIGWNSESKDNSPVLSESKLEQPLQSNKEKQFFSEDASHLIETWKDEDSPSDLDFDFVYPVNVSIRDPFQQKGIQIEPKRENKTSRPSLRLTGVIYGEQEPIAIFTDSKHNSYLVREKDKILNFTVKKIFDRSVLLTCSGKDIEFKVFDEAKLLAFETIRSQSRIPRKGAGEKVRK